jgi:hypothetical protein
MPSSTFKLLVLSTTLTCGASSWARAQAAGEPPAPSCDGLRVSRIDIQPGRPPFTGQASRWRNVARAVGLHHATTRDGVIDAFLALDVGEPCTEIRRAESERLLRAQPFLADATVRAIPDGAGGVAVEVRTVDEIPVLVNGRFRGLAPRALSLGNENVGGLGLLLEANIERGYAYRTGFGARIVEYATFGRPYVASLEAERYTLGHRVGVSLAHPFYTDLQRIGWHAGYLTSNEYPGLRRPARDELALGVRQERWEGSSLYRVFGTSTVGLLGAAASGLRLTPQPRGIVVSDTGLARDTGTTLLGRYSRFGTTRVGVLGGVRRVTFRTVRGFDGLTAQQDVANGAFAGLYVAKGLPSFGDGDLFLSGIAYAGGGGTKVYVASLTQVEGRRGSGLNRWDSVIGSSRSALYLGRGPGWVFITEDQFSGGTRSLLPLQLALGDRQGGILGYHESALAGAYRNVARTELRWTGASLVRNADVGFATFTQVGTIWAGDAPYGRNATRTSVGVSVLAAYPTGSKRLYRADVGIPLTRNGEGGGKIEVRFASEDRTQQFWREPHDVSRARTGTVPTSLFAFPTR